MATYKILNFIPNVAIVLIIRDIVPKNSRGAILYIPPILHICIPHMHYALASLNPEYTGINPAHSARVNNPALKMS